ncbi:MULTISPECIES: helix-turn-helix transcriptional regulator [unclassified Streptomyces]|uniref:ArsR/SmtB family transcription factor n=1 Tax=unclassified Streptomyces TaxID=2593676 RepID=UPI001587DD1E|nr:MULTISPECIES: metalloregulator ArsR/SmtB family transcription factor [unclassified Streptomyces]NUV68771.1 winged helix-turn-helix transcriptional regulator [Streptomyces sp. CAI-121]NUV98720.1 winged helix-turn-helix transcriptional regulator [Streptomyces sp. CAI 127]NUW14913.1 winged helix-turn-helix transcriptional regulator [Streptomyces sp. CAI-68]
MSETSLDRKTVEEYARWFRALADPTRIRIMRFLSGRPEPVPVGEIVDHLRINQSTVSHHLKILHTVRFLTRRRAGASIRYGINPRCITEFPSAADILIGAPVRSCGEPESS